MAKMSDACWITGRYNHSIMHDLVDHSNMREANKKEKTRYDAMYLGISEFYEPEKILVNGPATIVFWKDGTKTVVKLSEGDHYDEYTAYCIALTKKICGSNSKIKSIIKRTVKFSDSYTVLDSLIGKINELDNAINGGINNG